MNIRRPVEWARFFSRSFVLSVCAVAMSGAAFAQQSAPQDARLLSFLVGKNAKTAPTSIQRPVQQPVRATVPTFADSISTAEGTKNASYPEPILSVRAAYPASRPDPIRQAQYAEASVDPATAQLSTGLNATDAPYVDACPDPKDMPSILDVPYKIVPKPGLFPESCPLPDENYVRKAPTPITFTWKASSLCYKPLYFEDVQLERYGHYCHPLLQPFASRARFWLTVPILPYLMGVNPPNECIYDLGYYRPGNCAPSMLQPVPISLRGGLMEAGAIVGVAAIVP